MYRLLQWTRAPLLMENATRCLEGGNHTAHSVACACAERYVMFELLSPAIEQLRSSRGGSHVLTNRVSNEGGTRMTPVLKRFHTHTSWRKAECAI